MICPACVLLYVSSYPGRVRSTMELKYFETSAALPDWMADATCVAVSSGPEAVIKPINRNAGTIKATNLKEIFFIGIHFKLFHHFTRTDGACLVSTFLGFTISFVQTYEKIPLISHLCIRIMKIRLLLTGKTEEDFLKTGIREYEMRVKRYISFEIIEIPSLKNQVSFSHAEQKLRESELIQKQILPGDVVVLLDEHGKEMRSTEFASFLNKQFLSGNKTLVFLVGGPFGFDPSIKKRASIILSLSQMTFSHQMVRLFFTEQLYRALSILRGESYHHE